MILAAALLIFALVVFGMGLSAWLGGDPLADPDLEGPWQPDGEPLPTFRARGTERP